MAISNGNGRERGMMAEINVTPLVDVMLVLLIIFMVTAPMLTQGVDVNLPQANAKSLRSEEERLVITVDANSRIFVGKQPMKFNQL
ncbi:MAG: biopolymer transporter ExbD, partial [Thermodesulfobacteriota bacterium]|nr:biopolymer transporter ExbD [Thermodesulfobacteriota bacterium]